MPLPKYLVGRFADLSCDYDGDPGLLIVSDGTDRAPLGAVRFVGDAENRRVELEFASNFLAAGAAGHSPAHFDAVLLVLRYVFEDLGYNRVSLHCDAGDTDARRFAQQLGFLYEATLEQHTVLSGAVPSDIAVHRILSHEWSTISDNLHAILVALSTRTAAAVLLAPTVAGEAGDLTEEEEDSREQELQERGGNELPDSPPALRLPDVAQGHTPSQRPTAVALLRPRRDCVGAAIIMHGRTSVHGLLAAVEQKGGVGGVCSFLGTFTLKRRRHEIARDFDSTRAALRLGAAEQQRDGRPLSLWPAVLLHTVLRLRSHHADSWLAQRGRSTFPLLVQRCEEAGGPFEVDLVYLLSHLLYLTGLVDGLDKTMAGAPQDIAACFAEAVVRWLGGQCARRHAADLIGCTLTKSDRFGSTKKRAAAAEEQTPRKLATH